MKPSELRLAPQATVEFVPEPGIGALGFRGSGFRVSGSLETL